MLLEPSAKCESLRSSPSGTWSVNVNESRKNRLIASTERYVTKNNWRAVQRLWQPNVDRGDIDAKACLAHVILEYLNAPKCIEDQMQKSLQAAAVAGHADAAYWVCRWGKMKGAEGDAQLLRAGELGSRGAQRDLGAKFATGDWSGPKDLALAVSWYRKAAERGHDDAQYNLGFMLILGEGAPADVEEGLRWVTRAALQGDYSARKLLEDLYQNGYYGVPKRIDEANRWAHLLHVARVKQRRNPTRSSLNELRASR